MTEMLLLGAGASAEAGISTSFKMTKDIADQFRRQPDLVKYADVVSFIIGGLLFQRGIRGEDPFDGVDVEALFSAIELLASRHDLEAAPFIGSWHALVDQFDRITDSYPKRLDNLTDAIYETVANEVIRALEIRPRPMNRVNLDNAIDRTMRAYAEAKGARPPIPTHETVGGAISVYINELTSKWRYQLQAARPGAGERFRRDFGKAVQAQQSRPGGGQVFEETNRSMIQALKKLVWINDSARLAHLTPLARLQSSQPRLVIATLNYDNTIELLARAHRVPCDTGIERWSMKGDFDLAGEGIALLKLHGSIDWALETDQMISDRPMPRSAIRRVDSRNITDPEFRPAIIFGQRNKLTAEGPFLDLLRAFQRELSRSDRLTIVGYSFRDPHINEYLSQWINGSANHYLRIINHSFSESDVPYARMLREQAGHRIEAIAEDAGVGLARLWG